MVLLNIDGSHIHFGQNETMAGTVQDISFVVQNEKFDFILDLNNEKLDVKEGNVAVPIYFMEQYDLKIGEYDYGEKWRVSERVCHFRLCKRL